MSLLSKYLEVSNEHVTSESQKELMIKVRLEEKELQRHARQGAIISELIAYLESKERTYRGDGSGNRSFYSKGAAYAYSDSLVKVKELLKSVE